MTTATNTVSTPDLVPGVPMGDQIALAAQQQAIADWQEKREAKLEEQTEAADEITQEQQTALMSEAQKEIGLVVKALKTGNRETAVAQYLAGLHGLRYVNLLLKAGKARSYATDQLERELSLWMGKSVDANTILRTYASINLLHGDLEPPAKGESKEAKSAWSERADSLPPVGHFHKAYHQLVERVEKGGVETWVLLVGYEAECKNHYATMVAKSCKLDDTREKGGTVTEKGIATLTREFMAEYLRWKADKKAAEAGAKADAAEELQVEAKAAEDKATQQQAKVKELLAKATAEQDAEAKAKLDAEAKAAAGILEQYRKDLKQQVEAAAAVAKQAKAAQDEAVALEKKAEKQDAKLVRKTDDEAARELPWQARAENAIKAGLSRGDLAAALAMLCLQHDETEDVVSDMLAILKRDADTSTTFKASAAAFQTRWTNPVNQAAKIPA